MLLSDLVSYKNDCISSEATLYEAIDKMGREGINHIILVDHDTAIGVLTLKNIIELYRNGIDGTKKAIEYANYPVISIHLDRPVEMAVELMIDYEIRRVVLIDENEKYISTLTQSDILSYYETQIHNQDEVHQYLNRRNRAVTLQQDASVYEAIILLQNENRDVLIVCDQHNPVGIVTEEDILDLAYRNIPSSECALRSFRLG